MLFRPNPLMPLLPVLYFGRAKLFLVLSEEHALHQHDVQTLSFPSSLTQVYTAFNLHLRH